MADETPQNQWIGLKPVAQPTDQFSRPAVQKSVGGGKLMQLAAALKETSSTMDNVYQQRLAAEQQGMAMSADRLSEQRQFKNMQDLNGSVQRGEIPMWANPWFQVRLKQDTARNEASVAAKGVQNELNNSDTVHSDNPDDVHNFISGRFSKLMQGRDAWEAAAMKPQLEQAHAQMMSGWLQTRGEDRVREAHAATGNLIMSRMDGFDQVGYAKGDPQADKQLEGMTADIQQQYDTLLHVTDKATASQWISDAVINSARVHRNADVARTVLDGLKGQDGVKLSSTAANRAALEVLPREIQELKNADTRAETEGRQLAGVKERMNLMDEAKKMQKDQGAKELWQVKLTPEQWQKLSPEGYAEVQRFYATLSQEALTHKNVSDSYKAEPEIQRLLQGTVNGELKMPERVSLMASLAAHGEPGRNGVETFARFLHYQRDLQWGETSPTTLADMNRKIVSGTLTMDEVLKESEAGHLDQHSATEYMQMAANIQSSGGVTGRHSAMVGEATKQLHELVQSPYLEQGLIGGRGDSSQADEMRLKEAQSESAFLKEFHLKLVKDPKWDSMSFTEQQKQIDELRDSVARSYGGKTMQDFLKARPEAFAPEPVSKPVQRPAPDKQQPGQPQAAGVAPASDPFAADLDRNTLAGVKKMLSVKTDATLRDLMGPDAYNDAAHYLNMQARYVDLYHPPKTEEEYRKDEEGPLGKLGIRSIAGLEDYRRQVFTLRQPADRLIKKEDGSYGTGWIPKDVTIRSGENLGPDAEVILRSEQQLWQDSMAHLQALKPDATEAKNTLLSIHQQYQQSGKISFEQQQQAKQAAITITAFQELRDHVGYTPDEVKEAGDGAWRSMVMFANPLDLKERGPAALQKLGIKDFQASFFYEAQLRMMKILREDQK